MQLETLSFSRTAGWSTNFPAELDSDRTIVLAFGSSSLLDDPEPIVQLGRTFPHSHFIGCSTSGEIFGTKVLDDTIAAAVLRFDRGSVRRATAPVRSADESFAAGARIAAELAGPGLQGVFLLSDGLCVNGSELLHGVRSLLPKTAVVSGGLAGDGDRFVRTWVIRNGLPAGGCIAAVGIYGDGQRIGHGSKGGWDIFGPERKVTRSTGNVLYELDGKPALRLYKEYLGDRARGLPATALLFPLALRASAADEKQLVRTVLAVDEATQSMTFAGDIPQGALAQLMKANSERLINGASEAAVMTGRTSCAKAPMLAVAISCVGRRLVLGQRTEEELEATLDALPRGTQQIGFYSYGEISPDASGSSDLHNQTMTITTIGEE